MKNLNAKVKREIKVYGLTFIALIIVSLLLYAVMPDKIPYGFALTGIATNWIEKNTAFIHIPIPELIIYITITLMQRFYTKKDPLLYEYLHQIKLSLIIVIGVTYPVTTYLYAVKAVSNIWYLVLIIMFSWLIYIFIISIGSGLFNLKSKKNKKKKKWTKIKSSKK